MDRVPLPVRGWRPWDSPESQAPRAEPVKLDTPQQIRKCLECSQYRECVNCIAGGTRTARGRPAAVEPEMLSFLLELRTSDVSLCDEVCRSLGYSVRSVKYYAEKIRKEKNALENSKAKGREAV